METTPTIGQMVAEDYRTAAVFKRFHIDFCCKGNRTLDEACGKKNINPAEVQAALEVAKADRPMAGADALTWPLDLLIDYIEKTHHRYVRRSVEDIKPLLSKVVAVHGTHEPELKTIADLFLGSAEALLHHMEKEERVLFPRIRRMVEEGTGVQMSTSILGPIAVMQHEHAMEGDRFAQIAELTHGYTPPSHACNSYKVLFALLDEFEQDLHRHIHLENNILFPRALAFKG
jgi:regulator of cell morphogenesis and NO signaling